MARGAREVSRLLKKPMLTIGRIDLPKGKKAVSVMAVKETNFVQLKSGHRLCFAEYGDPAGEPVLYFHGWPSSRLQARLIHELCQKKGVRLVAIDRPGMGQSDFMEGRVLRDWPRMVEEFADLLEIETFSVMGVSGGGPYALAMAAWSPERVTRASVICGAPPLARFQNRREMMWPYRALLAIRPHVPWLLPPILRVAGWISLAPPTKPPMSWVLRWTSREDREALLEKGAMLDVTRSFREGIRKGVRGVQLEGDIYTADWQLDFSSISVPVDIWHGGVDRNIPIAMVTEYASWIPTAETHFFPKEGHYSIAMSKADEAIARLLQEKSSLRGEKRACIT